MNRRGFLTQLFQGAIVAVAAPQIVTHGLKLWTPRRGQFQFLANTIGVRAQLEACQVSYELVPYQEQFHLMMMDTMMELRKRREAEGRNHPTLDFYTDERGKRFVESFWG